MMFFPLLFSQDFDSSSIIYSRFKTYLVKSMSTYYFSKQTHRTAGKGERRIKKRTRRARQAGVEPLSGTDTDEAAEEQQLDSEDDLELSPPSRCA